MSNQLQCPHCKQMIEITEAISHEIKGNLEKEFQRKLSEERRILEAKEKELLAKQEAQDKEFEKRIGEEKLKMWKTAQEKALEQAQEKVATELKDMKAKQEEQTKKLEESQAQELELRKKTRELEEKSKTMELELARRLDKEREELSKKLHNDLGKEFETKLAEKDKQMEQMKRTITDLKRQSEQGSMQIQGDTREDQLKHLLQELFPRDLIEDVPTGIKGADLVHTVHTELGKAAGVILWESKQTKAWNNEWIKKLKDDQVQSGADICILATEILPKDQQGIAQIEGVWVVPYTLVQPFIVSMHYHIVELARSKSALVGQGEKMEIMYNYLSGPQFKAKVEGIVSAFQGMKEELDKEKRAFQRIWSKREQQIERVIMNTSGMYGDLQGIIGASLPSIQSLELEGPDELFAEEDEK